MRSSAILLATISFILPNAKHGRIVPPLMETHAPLWLSLTVQVVNQSMLMIHVSQLKCYHVGKCCIIKWLLGTQQKLTSVINGRVVRVTLLVKNFLSSKWNISVSRLCLNSYKMFQKMMFYCYEVISSHTFPVLSTQLFRLTQNKYSEKPASFVLIHNKYQIYTTHRPLSLVFFCPSLKYLC